MQDDEHWNIAVPDIDPTDPKFERAHTVANAAIERALMEFEQTTGRTVTSVRVSLIDISGLWDAAPRTTRHIGISCAPVSSDAAIALGSANRKTEGPLH